MSRPSRIPISAVACALVGALSCVQVSEQPELAGQDLRLTVLHTSDIHSRILPYFQQPGLIDRGLGFCTEFQPFGGAARIQRLIKRERAKAQRVMHLDSGDCFQGAPIFNSYRGEVEVKVMSQLRPDGVVVGNHEFDLGSSNLAFQYGRFGAGIYPLLAANYIWTDPSDPTRHDLGLLIKPYEIVNLDGLKVAVIGMGNTSSMTSLSDGGNSLGITPLEPLEALRSWVNILEPQVDLVFVVSHMGLTARNELNLAEDTQAITGYERVVPADAVQPNWEKIGDEPDGQVRVFVPGVVGIDAIFGGHLHIVLNPPKVLIDPEGRRVPLIHSGAFAKFVGRMDLVVHMPKPDEDAPHGAEIVTHDYSLFPVTNRVPKAKRDDVVACPEGGVPTFEKEAGVDEVGVQTPCLELAAAARQIRVCEIADQCRLKGDACTDECRKARRDCSSVDAPVDGAMLEMLDPYVQGLYQTNDLNRGFAYATDLIRRFGTSGEDSPLGNLVADSMRKRNRIEAQFSMTNSLGIRTNMESGLVTIEQMFNIFPFENTLTTMFMSGTEVQELFDYSTFRSSERGCQSQIQISGVTFTMNCAQALANENDAPTCQTSADCQDTDFAATGSKHPVRCQEGRCYKSPAEDIMIEAPGVGGEPSRYEPLNPTESYKVAVNDFIGRGGSGFEVLKRNTTKVETGLSLRDALIDHMRAPPEAGGPGRICGSKFMVEPIKRPIRPLVVVKKSPTQPITCSDEAAHPTGCKGESGKLIDCVEDDESVSFYCIPYDFRDPTADPSDNCSQMAEVTPVFESLVRPRDSEGPGCGTALSRACSGQLHCCERPGPDDTTISEFYCVTPYCIDSPPTGRITRVIK